MFGFFVGKVYVPGYVNVPHVRSQCEILNNCPPLDPISAAILIAVFIVLPIGLIGWMAWDMSR